MKRPLTIAVAAEDIPDIRSGLGYFLFKALSELAAAEPDWRFKVVACGDFTELGGLEAPNVSVVYWDDAPGALRVRRFLERFVPPNTAYTAGQLAAKLVPTRRLASAFGDLRAIWAGLGEVDAVWVPHFSIIPWPAYFPMSRDLEMMGAPVVFTIHDIQPAFFPEDWQDEALERFEEDFAGFARRSALVVTHSAWQKEEISKRLGVSSDRIEAQTYPPLIDPPVLLRAAPGAAADRAAELGVEGEFFFYPGSTTLSHKNHVRLLLAWGELVRSLGADCPALVCTAKGAAWPVLRSLIEALGLQGKVFFTGLVDTPTLASLYSACRAVIVPTLYEGGGAGPVAEASLARKPLLCSNIPPVVEHLDFYGTGVTYFDPTRVDAITSAVRVALEGMDELESRARRNQEAFLPRVPELWRRCARFYADSFRRVIS